MGDRLCVLWTDREGQRWDIGELWRSPEGDYAFGYRLDLLRQAKEAGFRLLPEFPDPRGLDAPYRSARLFSTFSQRVPSPKRADYKQMLEAWGVESKDPLEILSRSGGVLHTDRLELAAYRPPDGDRSLGSAGDAGLVREGSHGDPCDET